jgi:ectoine hydroxylase-related dioxygenase (phytanoyl-CoA dioxygenase family)
MFQQTFHTILKKIFYIPEPRMINPDYFLDPEAKDFFCRNGYVVIKNIVSDEAIHHIEATYALLHSKPEFHEAEGFITTPNYGEELQQLVCTNLTKVNNLVLPAIADTSKCTYDFFSILVMKFNKDNSYVEPHQDISMVDESISGTTFLWIPTVDIDDKNGAILVLPGSHIWATWQKTHNRDITPLKKNAKWLLEKMIPVYMNRGDVLLFDASLIHGSLPNISPKERIAMNTSIIPKNTQMVHYEKNSSTPKGMIEKYIIDTDFWKNTGYIHSLAGKNHPVVIERFLREKQLSKFNLNYLNNKYNPAVNTKIQNESSP